MGCNSAKKASGLASISSFCDTPEPMNKSSVKNTQHFQLDSWRKWVWPENIFPCRQWPRSASLHEEAKEKLLHHITFFFCEHEKKVKLILNFPTQHRPQAIHRRGEKIQFTFNEREKSSSKKASWENVENMLIFLLLKSGWCWTLRGRRERC